MLRVLMLSLALSVCGQAGAQLVLTPKFVLNVTEIIEPELPEDGAGYAGVGFDGSNYWVTKWSSDLIVKISLAGEYVESFAVPGLQGTRGLTWDGTHFWASNSTTTLSRIDPASKTVVDTLIVPASARYVAYDPTADGGAGGFWIGDFNSDILLVNMAGQTQQTIPAATVGFPGRYGAAFDGSGPAPVLWLFYQGGANNTQLGAISLPSGTPRAETLDLLPLIPGASSALAGGLFFTTALEGGLKLLLALAQGDPNALVAVEVTPPPLIFADRFE